MRNINFKIFNLHCHNCIWHENLGVQTSLVIAKWYLRQTLLQFEKVFFIFQLFLQTRIVDLLNYTKCKLGLTWFMQANRWQGWTWKDKKRNKEQINNKFHSHKKWNNLWFIPFIGRNGIFQHSQLKVDRLFLSTLNLYTASFLTP